MNPLELAYVSWLGLALIIELLAACPTVPAPEPADEVITMPAEEEQP